MRCIGRQSPNWGIFACFLAAACPRWERLRRSSQVLGAVWNETNQSLTEVSDLIWGTCFWGEGDVVVEELPKLHHLRCGRLQKTKCDKISFNWPNMHTDQVPGIVIWKWWKGYNLCNVHQIVIDICFWFCFSVFRRLNQNNNKHGNAVYCNDDDDNDDDDVDHVGGVDTALGLSALRLVKPVRHFSWAEQQNWYYY